MIDTVKINLYNQTRHPVNVGELENLASSILHDTQLGGIVEIDLKICGKLFMRKINCQYRNIDRETDVLSFPLNQFYRGRKTKSALPSLPDIPTYLGDILVCYDVAQRQAKENNKTTEEEIGFLFAHGLKHLLGFHHK